jgi:hypothetical protein
LEPDSLRTSGSRVVSPHPLGTHDNQMIYSLGNYFWDDTQGLLRTTEVSLEDSLDSLLETVGHLVNLTKEPSIKWWIENYYTVFQNSPEICGGDTSSCGEHFKCSREQPTPWPGITRRQTKGPKYVHSDYRPPQGSQTVLGWPTEIDFFPLATFLLGPQETR